MNGLQKARDNRKTNRSIRNSERFQNIISVIKDSKKDDNIKPTEPTDVPYKIKLEIIFTECF